MAISSAITISGAFFTDSNVSGNVQVNNNNVNPHGKGSIIEDNIIGKDLQCQNNSPPPQVGNNTVVGNPDQSSEGQCLERQRQL